MAHSHEDNCSEHPDYRPSIQIYKKTTLPWAIILDFPAFPKDPGKCLYFYLKESWIK